LEELSVKNGALNEEQLFIKEENYHLKNELDRTSEAEWFLRKENNHLRAISERSGVYPRDTESGFCARGEKLIQLMKKTRNQDRIS